MAWARLPDDRVNLDQVAYVHRNPAGGGTVFFSGGGFLKVTADELTTLISATESEGHEPWIGPGATQRAK